MKRRKQPWLALAWAVVFGLAAGKAAAGYIDHMSDANDIGRNKVPRTGTRPVLVLRIEIGTVADWSSVADFYDPANASDGFSRYWEVQSIGAYRPEAVLPPPIHFDTCPMPPPHDDCVIDRGDVTALVPALGMLRDVLRRAHDELGVDFSQFDSNADGWTDGVAAIINTDVGGIALPVAELSETLTGFTPADFTFDGVRVNAVAVAKLSDTRNYLHEFGHLIGFDDMYNEDALDGTNPALGLEPNPGSAWSRMGSGYGRYTSLNAVDRVKAGWATVVPVTSTLAAALVPPVLEGGVVYQLGSGNEYFLIENRRPSSPADAWYPWDSDVAGSGGLAVYRVLELHKPNPTFTIIPRLLECPNCNEFSPFIFFEQADGAFEYQSEAGFDHEKDPADFFATGDQLVPRPDDTSPLSRTNLVLRSNYLSGAVNGAAIRDVDADASYPDVVARFEPMAPPVCGQVPGGRAAAPLASLLPLVAAGLGAARVRGRWSRSRSVAAAERS
ncbi:MAG: hypothetical protein U0610_09245 [bacterium]